MRYRRYRAPHRSPRLGLSRSSMRDARMSRAASDYDIFGSIALMGIISKLFSAASHDT